MVKTTITETTEKYDENGKLIEKVTREEVTEDDTKYYPSTPLVTPYNNLNCYYCSVASTNDNNVYCERAVTK